MNNYLFLFDVKIRSTDGGYSESERTINVTILADSQEKAIKKFQDRLQHLLDSNEKKFQ